MPNPVKSDPPVGRFSLRFGYLVFLGVFALRLAALLRLTHSSLLLPARGDMHFYNNWAKQILHGQFTQPLAFYGLPGYAYLLALLYKPFGENPFIPGFLQAAVDAATAVVIFQICVTIFVELKSTSRARAVGAIAALGWVFFVPAQAYS